MSKAGNERRGPGQRVPAPAMLGPVDRPIAGQPSLPLDEAVLIANPYASDPRERSILAQAMATRWRYTCRHVEDRIAFLARHAGGRCPV